MILTTITGPAELAVSVDEAKGHSYISGTDDDLMIERMLKTAISLVETLAGAALVTQTLERRLEAWPTGEEHEPGDGQNWIYCPRYPLVSVSSVKYTDSAGTEQTWSSDNYIVDVYSQPGRIWLGYGAGWPSATLRPGPSIAVRYVAGFGDAADVPDALKSAVLLYFGDLYEHREQTVLQPGVTKATVDAALSLVRNWRR